MIELSFKQKSDIMLQIPFKEIENYMRNNDWKITNETTPHYPSQKELEYIFNNQLQYLLFNGGWSQSFIAFKLESKVEGICTIGFYKLIKLNQPISLEGYNDPLWEITLKEEDYNISL